LKKAGEKHFFAAEYPTHSVRVLFGGMFSQQIIGLSFSLTATNLSGQTWAKAIIYKKKKPASIPARL